MSTSRCAAIIVTLSAMIAVVSGAGAESETARPAGSEPPAELSEADFARIDSNHDSVITQEEWALTGRDTQIFVKADVNFDGKLTLREFLQLANTIHLSESAGTGVDGVAA